MRKNGFTFPLHPYQLCVWGIVSFNLIVFSVCVLEYLENLFFVLGCFLSFLVFIALGIVLTSSDPTAQSIDLENCELRRGLFCARCDIYVNEGTRHCAQCKRCVEGFDHHCKWLNNCIGKKNYKLFIAVIYALLTATTLMLIAETLTIDSWSSTYDNVTLVGISLALNSAIIVCDGVLIGFHLYFWVKGITTYEYIKKRWTKVSHESASGKAIQVQSSPALVTKPEN